jgi:Na+-driven multidrug efflux pump
VYAVAIGLSMAATAVVARRIGEKDREAANQTAVQVLFLGIFISLIISAFGIMYPNRRRFWLYKSTFRG